MKLSLVRTREDDDVSNNSSIGSYSTEEHDESGSSTIVSDSDREHFDVDKEGLLDLDNRLGGMSDMHRKSCAKQALSLWMRADGTREYQWFLGQRFHIAWFAE